MWMQNIAIYNQRYNQLKVFHHNVELENGFLFQINHNK